MRQWGTDLDDLVSRIRSRAPSARIVALNLPNLAGAPYDGGQPTAEKSLIQRVAVGLTDRVNGLTAQGVLVVDLMCDARLYQSSNYASDGFHPGDGGYRVFAELALPALRDGANTQPNANCAPNAPRAVSSNKRLLRYKLIIDKAASEAINLCQPTSPFRSFDAPSTRVADPHRAAVPLGCPSSRP